MLIVGGGPAGAAAAIYSARKGLRPASSPSASAARCWTRWPSRTSSRCRRPKDRSSPPRSRPHVKSYDVDIMDCSALKRPVPRPRLTKSRWRTARCSRREA